MTVAISSPSLRQQRICDSPSGSRGLPPWRLEGNATPRTSPVAVSTAIRACRCRRQSVEQSGTGQHGPSPTGWRPDPLFAATAGRTGPSGQGRPGSRSPRRAQKGPGWEGLRMATLADRPGAPAHAAIKPDRARPPASWRCVTGRPVGRTKAGGRWRRQAHQPTDRIRKVKPHNRYGQQRRLADEKTVCQHITATDRADITQARQGLNLPSLDRAPRRFRSWP